MLFLPDGRLVATVPELNKVLIMEQNGKIVGNFGGEGGEPGKFNRPTGVALSPEGQLFVVDSWNHRIQIFDPKGVPKL